MFRLFAPLFAEIDNVTRTFASDVSSRIVVAITPVVSAGLTLWFVVWGVLVMRGAVHQPVVEFLGKVIRTALIVSIALGAGLYQSRIAELVRTLPDDLAAVVSGGSGTGQAEVIDRAAGEGLGRAQDAWEKGTIMTQQGMAFYTFGVLLLLATVFMVAVGGATILTAKVILALLAALGPLFIAALLFDATKRFFQNWVAMIAAYTLVVVLFACVFTFMLAIFANYMNGVQLDGNMNVAYGIGGAVVLTIVSLIVLKEVHVLAMALGGGYTFGLRAPAFFGVFSGGGARGSTPPPPAPPRTRPPPPPPPAPAAAPPSPPPPRATP